MITALMIILIAVFMDFIVVLFKVKLFDPSRKKKEQNNNPEFMALYNLAHTLNDARNKKKEELKELQNSIDKFTNFSHYLPIEVYEEYKASLEPLKKQFYNVMAEIMDYDELIKKSYEEMNKIRKEKKLKYL